MRLRFIIIISLLKKIIEEFLIDQKKGDFADLLK